MSDDLDKKIQQIAEMLGQDKVPDNIKSLVSLLAGSMSSKEDGAAKAPESEDEPPEEETAAQTGSDGDSGNTEEMMRKVKKAVEDLKSNNDPRINLLHAISPFMSSKRQKKISNAIQLLQISGAAKLMNNDK